MAIPLGDFLEGSGHQRLDRLSGDYSECNDSIVEECIFFVTAITSLILRLLRLYHPYSYILLSE